MSGDGLKKIKSQEEKCVWSSGRLPRRRCQHLAGELHFDVSDIKFVAAAYRSSSGLLVSGDTDYTSTIRTYLHESLDVRALTVAEALALANVP